MGDRGARNELATPDDIAAMARIVQGGDRGRRARLLDVTHDHRAIDGEPFPHLCRGGRTVRLGRRWPRAVEPLRVGPAGVAEDIIAPKKELEWMQRLARSTARSRSA